MLSQLKQLYNIVLMTASVRVYAEKVIEVIDPKNQYFQLLICKDTCKQYPGGKTIKDLLIFKDLYEQQKGGIQEEENMDVDEFENSFLKEQQKLGRFKYEDIVLVDNFSSAYANQKENGIPIIPYYGATTKVDEELRSLTLFLKDLNQEKDVREVVRNHFMTHLMEESKDIQQFLAKIRAQMSI